MRYSKAYKAKNVMSIKLKLILFKTLSNPGVEDENDLDIFEHDSDDDSHEDTNEVFEFLPSRIQYSVMSTT